MFATSRISAVILVSRVNSANPDISRNFCLATWIFFQISDCGSTVTDRPTAAGVSLGVVDLHSMTSQAPGDVDQSRPPSAGGERQRAVVTAGAKLTSYASRSLEKVRSWFKMPSGHHQQSGLHSRLHTTTAGHPTQEVYGIGIKFLLCSS